MPRIHYNYLQLMQRSTIFCCNELKVNAVLKVFGNTRETAIPGGRLARFLDFVGENITRAAEQAREVLYTKAEAISPSSSPTREPI
jgi:hypothetical protein